MSANEAAADLGPLPQWDLSDLYPGRDSTQLTSRAGRQRERRPAISCAL